jgi:hypothetical protein
MNYFRQTYCLLIGTVGTFLISCGNPAYMALKQLESMPKLDYSYVVEPEFIASKDELEFKIKGLYEAEEVRFSIATFHGYDNKTNEQINEDFWVRFVIYNSPTVDIYDENELHDEGRVIAKLVMEALKNKDSYDKIQITFMKQWQEGDNIRQVKHPEFYKYPSFEEIKPFEE